MLTRRTLAAAAVALGLGLVANVTHADADSDCGNTEIDIDGIDVLVQALGNNGEGTLGPRRLVVDQTGTITSYGTRTFVQGAPMDSDRAILELRKTAGKGRTTVTICTTDSAGTRRILREFEIPTGEQNIGQTWRFDLTGLHHRRLSVRLVGKHATRSMSYSMTLARPGAGTPRVPNKSGLAANTAVVGFADLHNHQASPEGFGGAPALWRRRRLHPPPKSWTAPRTSRAG